MRDNRDSRQKAKRETLRRKDVRAIKYATTELLGTVTA